MKPISHKSFPDLQALGEWMADNHATAKEVWVRIYKAASGKPSVTWTDCVIEAIRYGWIDGHKKPLDESSFLGRGIVLPIHMGRSGHRPYARLHSGLAKADRIGVDYESL